MRTTNIEIICDRNGESVSISDIRPSIIVGFGLHHTWMFATMFAGARGLPTVASQLFDASFFTVSLAIYVITFLCCAALESRLRPCFFTARAIGAATVCDALSTLAILGGAVPGAAGVALFVFSSIVSGIATATLILQWGNVFSRLDIPSSVINAALAFVAGVAAFMLLVQALPYPFVYIAAALAAVAEGVLLCHCVSSRPRIIEGGFEVKALPVRRGAFFRQLCAPMVLLGVAAGLFGQSSLRALFAHVSQADQVVVIAAASLTALLFIILTFATSDKHLYFLYRPLLPVVACALLLVPQSNSLGMLTHLVLLMGYLCLDVLTWITPCEICGRFRISPLVSFGICRGCLALGTLLVNGVQQVYAAQMGTALVLNDFSIVAIALVMLAVGYVLLPRQQDLQALAAVREVSPETLWGRRRGSGPGQSGGEPSQPGVGTGRPGNGLEQPDGGRRHADAGADGDTSSPGSTSDPRAAFPKEPGHDTGEDTAGAPRAERFTDRCQTVADRFFLTNKETEILFLLAKGRNAAVIQEQLFISENTVRTHMRHIYRKLDVHTQQELIDLIDQQG